MATGGEIHSRAWMPASTMMALGALPPDLEILRASVSRPSKVFPAFISVTRPG